MLASRLKLSSIKDFKNLLVSSQILTCLKSPKRSCTKRPALISPPFLLLPDKEAFQQYEDMTKKRTYFLILLLPFPCLLLPSSTAADWTSQQITVDGLDRSYLKYEPVNYNSADGNGVVVLFPSIKINMSPNRDWHNIM